MLTLEHGGKTFANFEPGALLTAGVPQATIDLALAEARRTEISAECRRRIYAVASAETQLNLTAAMAAISAKSEVDRTADDLSVLAGAQAAVGWVGQMRAQVDLMAADPAADHLQDAAWPDLPPEAQATIAIF